MKFNKVFIEYFVVFIMAGFFLRPLILPLILIGCLCILLLFSYNKNTRRNSIKDNALFLFFYFLMSTTLLYSENLTYGLSKLTLYLPFLIFPFLFWFFPKLSNVSLLKIEKGYVKVLLFTLILLFFYGIYRSLVSFQDNEFYRNIITSYPQLKFLKINFWSITYDGYTKILDIDPIYLALFVNLGSILLSSIYLKKEIKTRKYILIQLFYFINLIMISSRWQILIFCFLLLTTLLFFNRKMILQTFLVLGLMFLIFNVINPISLNRVMTSVTTSSDVKVEYGGLTLRTKKWKSAMNVINESLFFGYGVGDYLEKLLAQYREDDFTFGLEKRYNSHNQYLDTTIQGGVVLLVVLLAIFVVYFKGALVHKNYALLAIVFLYFVSFLTESILERQRGVVSFVFLLCLFNRNEFYKIEKHE